MATDGTQSRTTRPAELIGFAFILLVVVSALQALTRRKGDGPETADLAETPIDSAESIPRARQDNQSRRGMPRFFTGAFTGITTGIALGAVAVLITLSAPDVRSTVVLGAELPVTPPPTTEGQYVARVLVQVMNPTLTFADPEVAALYAPKPVEPEPAPLVGAPVANELQDNAATVFIVLGALTVASWGLVMWGLNAASRASQTLA